jgi:hypothetical protein
MGIKVIPLWELEADLERTLAACLDSGEALVVELPDRRLVSIHSLEPADDDPLVDELLASNPAFRALVERSKASARLPLS